MSKKTKKVSLFPHKYRAGDIVGVIADCMADCEIVSRLRKTKGKALSYVARAVKIHHSNPKESFFGQHKKFILKERNILVLLTNQLTYLGE